MKINIIAIGKMRNHDSNYQLFAEYQKRLPWKIDLRELEVKSNLANLKEKEADLLLAAIPAAAKVIVLDERGSMLSSRDLAKAIKDYGNSGSSNLAFIIGGADGVSDRVKNRADLILSFSKMTFPHLMIRSFLIEQIYRSYTIISNHPYHRD